MAVKVPLMGADALALAILEAIGLPEQFPARRVIVDCEAGSLATVYIESFASDKLLDLDWARGLRGAHIQILDKGEAKVGED